MIPQQSDTPVSEQLSSGVTFERQGNIFIFILHDISRQSVDAWANKVEEVSDSLAEGQKFLVVHHFAASFMSMSPYLKARTEQLRAASHVEFYSAIILPKSGVIQTMTALMTKLNRAGTTRFFTDREQGLGWLRQISDAGGA